MKIKILIAVIVAALILATNWKKTPFDFSIGLRASNVLVGGFSGYGPMSFYWKQVGGPTQAIIDSPTRLRTPVREMNYPGTYSFELKTTSLTTGLSDPDTVDVIVKPPIADILGYNGKLVIVSRVAASAEIKITKRVFWIWTATYLNTKRDIRIGINYVDVPVQGGTFTATVKYGGQTYTLKFTK